MSLDKPKQEGYLASDVEALKRSISNNLRYRSGKIPLTATRGDWLLAAELAVRNRLVERWLKSNTAVLRAKCQGRLLSFDGISDRAHFPECAGVAGYHR